MRRVIVPTLIGGALAILTACATPAPAPTPAPTAAAVEVRSTVAPLPTTAPVTTIDLASAPTISLGVTASGEVVARSSANLSFRVPGVVAEVFVAEGDRVKAGDPLVALDARELELQVAQAEASLAQARANYERLIEGATPEEIAAVRAQVAQAQAALRQARGSVTDADIAAAEAALAQAIARRNDLLDGPNNADLTAAWAAVEQAEANLNLQRTNLSAAKTNAELQVTLAANALRDAQQAYSDLYWKNREREEQLAKFGLELPKEAKDAEEQLLRAVESAETRYKQAQLAYEQARQNEIDGIAAAEAQVRTARSNLQRLLDGPTADLIAAADAAVAQAQATLDRLRGDQRAGALAAAQAGVAAAQANLERITAPPTRQSLTAAEAAVKIAETALAAAKLNLDKAVLRAPFDGIVARVNVDPGDLAGTGALPAVQIVDDSELHIEAAISDTDVARVREGQRVEVRIDALPGTVFNGTVDFVAPVANVVGNVRTFTVRVKLAEQNGLRAGMSVRITILTDK
ncbi:HlyD family secretion protein [uncultured Chloroflexus sp.]|uniref:HlyD family secretion protein n=1 Tax=uncultured Chloroflexus sp. TaxID=214040 RepID=UPI00261D56A2|nr:efflux RND transporter periplasmic adaptor subunit [uncultured Chloroflexus sp.]